MEKFCVTKCLLLLDMVLQILIFSSHFGVLLWNGLQKNRLDKYFAELGYGPLIVGMVSAMPSFELDVFLLYFIEWEYVVGLYWWNLACLVLAIISWSSYLGVAIYIQNLYLGLWAFLYLYSRATLIMTAKAESVGVFQRVQRVKRLVSRCSSVPQITFESVESTPRTCRVVANNTSKSKEAQPVDVVGENSKLHHDENDGNSVEMTGGQVATFCTFLGPTQFNESADYSILMQQPVIKVNEDINTGELQTKL